MKYFKNQSMDLHQIHREDIFGPLCRQVSMPMSKVKVTRDKNHIFWPFWRPVW